MPKPTREADWRARIDLPESPYTENELEHIVEAIEEGANCQLSTPKRRRLKIHVKSAARAFLTAKHQDDGPTHGQIKAALEDLQEAADKLLSVVEELDDGTLYALWRQHGEFRKAYDRARAQNHENAHVGALGIVSGLSAEAETAIKEVGKPYPPPGENLLSRMIIWEQDPIYQEDTPVTKFIIWLADIFDKITEQEPLCNHDRANKTYSRNFYPFVDACLSPLEGKSRRAIGRKVQTDLKKWRRLRDATAQTEDRN